MFFYYHFFLAIPDWDFASCSRDLACERPKVCRHFCARFFLQKCTEKSAPMFPKVRQSVDTLVHFLVHFWVHFLFPKRWIGRQFCALLLPKRWIGRQFCALFGEKSAQKRWLIQCFRNQKCTSTLYCTLVFKKVHQTVDQFNVLGTKSAPKSAAQKCRQTLGLSQANSREQLSKFHSGIAHKKW